ncbi:MAG: hypothetical protein V1857_02560 [archaeon]
MTSRTVTCTKQLMIIAMLSLCISFYSVISVDSRILTSEDSSAAIDRAKTEFRRAFVAVRENEAYGVDQARLGLLVERLNLIIWMIDRSERLSLRCDIQEAIAQADRAVEFSKAVISEAITLRHDTSQQISYEGVLRFAIVPLVSLLLAVGTYYGYRRWRNN